MAETRMGQGFSGDCRALANQAGSETGICLAASRHAALNPACVHRAENCIDSQSDQPYQLESTRIAGPAMPTWRAS